MKTIATQTAFMLQGFLRETQDASDNTGMGQIEVALMLEPWAVRASMVFDLLNNRDFPGVFAYEVSEEFGAWMYRYHHECYNTGKVPAHDVMAGALVRHVMEFMGHMAHGELQQVSNIAFVRW